MKTAKGIVKINLKQSRTAYLITGIVLLCVSAGEIVMAAFPVPGNMTIALGNYLYLLPILMAIFIPAKNFSRLMNLGVKRKDFFKACAIDYTIIAAVAALFNIILHLLLDPLMERYIGIISLLDAFGFMRSGAVVAFFQMSAFLLLFSCVLHTLTLAQSHWYGVVADILIVAIISVFTPIAPLRAALVWFFNMIIFNESVLVQIASCLVLGAAVYSASLIPIRRKCV